jgi:DNA-binding XRE family transcriptional regulator
MNRCYENTQLTYALMLIYRSDMGNGGRPVERPAHLSAEQRLDAQRRTREWRSQCGLSQRDMASEIGVGYSTYRLWENGQDRYAGPTRLQADQLNKALCKRLAGRYADGEAFEAWGWPRQQDMSYAQVTSLLHETGFEVPRANPNGSVPACVFWVHRVREPTLVHGVFSLAAAAATRAGLPVHLLLDDVELTDGERSDRCEEIVSRIRGWIAFASGNDARLTTSLYSEVLTDEYLMRRGWSAVIDYLSTSTSVLQFLRASKAISPQQYSTDAEASALELLRNENSIRTDRLLTALRNWLVFEAEIGRLLDMPSTGSGSVVTLGGGDERVLWDIWRRGCPRGLPARVQHILLKPMPTPSSQTWDEPALTASDTSRSALESYLIKRIRSDGHTDLVDWLLKAAVRLPAELSPAFRDGLLPLPASTEILTGAFSQEPARAVAPLARAIVEWFAV